MESMDRAGLIHWAIHNAYPSNRRYRFETPIQALRLVWSTQLILSAGAVAVGKMGACGAWNSLVKVSWILMNSATVADIVVLGGSLLLIGVALWVTVRVCKVFFDHCVRNPLLSWMIGKCIHYLFQSLSQEPNPVSATSMRSRYHAYFITQLLMDYITDKVQKRKFEAQLTVIRTLNDDSVKTKEQILEMLDTSTYPLKNETGRRCVLFYQVNGQITTEEPLNLIPQHIDDDFMYLKAQTFKTCDKQDFDSLYYHKAMELAPFPDGVKKIIASYSNDSLQSAMHNLGTRLLRNPFKVYNNQTSDTYCIITLNKLVEKFVKQESFTNAFSLILSSHCKRLYHFFVTVHCLREMCDAYEAKKSENNYDARAFVGILNWAFLRAWETIKPKQKTVHALKDNDPQQQEALSVSITSFCKWLVAMPTITDEPIQTDGDLIGFLVTAYPYEQYESWIKKSQFQEPFLRKDQSVTEMLFGNFDWDKTLTSLYRMMSVNDSEQLSGFELTEDGLCVRPLLSAQ